MLVFARAVFVGPGCAVGGGPPASRPRREPAARGVVSKPGQAPPPPTSTAARPAFTPQASRQALAPLTPVPTPNFACNSPTTTSNLEFRSLELQRFQSLLKLLPIELRASFRRQRRATTHRHRSGAHLHAAVRPRKREKILPARAKHPKISTFSPAGRIFSRFGPESTPAGRIFSRP